MNSQHPVWPLGTPALKMAPGLPTLALKMAPHLILLPDVLYLPRHGRAHFRNTYIIVLQED